MRGLYVFDPGVPVHERLDRAIHALLVADYPGLSMGAVRRALERGEILVDGRRAKAGAEVRGAQAVDAQAWCRAQASPLEPDPELADRVEVIHQCDELLVLNKPSGVATQPLHRGEAGTLLHAALHFAPDIAQAGPALEGGLVHRLDVGTSGVVVFARNANTRTRWRAAFDTHRVKKTYLVATEAHVAPQHIHLALAARGVPVRPAQDGLSAHSEVLAASELRVGITRVRTHTGRRHQIRVHLASLGAPLLGDTLYGGADAARLGLHAESVEFEGRFVASAGADFLALVEDD